jgi:hypothetical protein
MSTRRAAAGSKPSQQGYASAAEYIALRVDGNMLAKKAEFLNDPKKTSLLLFLHSMSMRPGGLERFASEFLAKYESRLGSNTMHKAGIRSGQVYSVEQSQKISCELGSPLSNEQFKELLGGGDVTSFRRMAAHCVAECRALSASLPDFMVEFCVNPKVPVKLPSEMPAGDAWLLPYFKDFIGALLDYQSEFAETERSNFVMTEAALQVFDALDAGLRRGGITMIEGVEGIGKSESGQAWCRMHHGEARYVKLVGITNRTQFFRKISEALGLPVSGQKVADMQSRVEAAIKSTGVMLVFDEAQYLLPQSKRIYIQPELVNWIYTACTNEKVPVALIATSVFGEQMRHVEQQVAWNARQFQRRIRVYVRLPDNSTLEDLLAIARKLLPGSPVSAVKSAAGYALAMPQRLTNLIGAIEEAKFVASENGREVVICQDIEAAFKGCVIPSEQAKAAAFTPIPNTRGKRPKPLQNSAPVRSTIPEPDYVRAN